ncbi:MAG: FKBP-type peptidyl-prolyl cis-trans isomerase [Gammaproteobacteria bacterium]
MKKLLHTLTLTLLTMTCVAEDTAMTDKQKLSYALGVFFSQNIMQQNIELDEASFLKAVSDVLHDNPLQLTPEEIQAVFTDFRAKEQQQKQALAEQNMEAGQQFLADNKKQKGVISTASGLQYKIIKPGAGDKPSPDGTYTVHYRGTLIDGTEFDSSYSRNQPFSFKLNGVIAGWQEALPLMRTGARWQLFIPAELAYGERSQGQIIGPQSTLVFEVELLSAE